MIQETRARVAGDEPGCFASLNSLNGLRCKTGRRQIRPVFDQGLAGKVQLLLGWLAS